MFLSNYQTGHVSFRVFEPGKLFAVRKRNRADHFFTTSCFNLHEAFFDIFYLYVKDGIVMRLVTERSDMSLYAFDAVGLKQRSHRYGGGRPTEKFAIKFGDALQVFASYFEVNNGVAGCVGHNV